MSFLHIVVLTVHLLTVGVGVCLPLSVILLSRKAFKIQQQVHQAAIWEFCRGLLKQSIIALCFGTVLGFILAGVIWSTEYHQRCHLVMTKIKWAGIEWAFTFVVLIWVHRTWPKNVASGKSIVGRGVLLLIASLNLLYHFPILFMVIDSIPAETVQKLSQSGDELSRTAFREIASRPELLSRWFHASMALFAVVMAYVAVACIRKANQYEDGADRDSAISICRWASRNVLLLLFGQIAFGIWTVIAMDRVRLGNLMGGRMPPTLLFGLSMILLFVQLQQWTGLTGERVHRLKLVQAVATFITMFVCMVAASVLS